MAGPNVTITRRWHSILYTLEIFLVGLETLLITKKMRVYRRFYTSQTHNKFETVNVTRKCFLNFPESGEIAATHVCLLLKSLLDSSNLRLYKWSGQCNILEGMWQ